MSFSLESTLSGVVPSYAYWTVLDEVCFALVVLQDDVALAE